MEESKEPRQQGSSLGKRPASCISEQLAAEVGYKPLVPVQGGIEV